MQPATPLYVVIGDHEANSQRIAAVERLFSFPVNKLLVPKRVLVGEGVLTKICRRKPKLRHFFLFNDLLLYGRIIVHRKVLRNPHYIDLIDCSVVEVNDNGIFRNGFSILSPKKSFTVYSSTAEEKAHWIAHLHKCIAESRFLAGAVPKEVVKQSPVWIPDSEARTCMACGMTEFSLVNRRHHCRHCGKVVCHKCSTYRWILPHLGTSRVRVCRLCHAQLQADKERQLVRQQSKKQEKLQWPEDPSDLAEESTPDPANFFTELHGDATVMARESGQAAEPTYIGNASDEPDTESEPDSETTDSTAKS